MGSSGRLIGMILIGVGILVFLGGAVASLVSTMGESGGTVAGAVLGVVISLFVATPLVGGGIYMMIHGRSEAARQVGATRQRKILDMVKTRGQVEVRDLVMELNSTTDQVREDIYTVVGMGLLKGYVNWDQGVLYSQDAAQLKGKETCPNCGGALTLAGKGIITCPYCGSQIFL